MRKIELVKTPNCAECEKVKKIIAAEIKPLFPDLEVVEIDATTPQGAELVQKYGIMSSPGVIINGELISMGGINKEVAVAKLKAAT
jgi:glutaredoxin